jgi:diacylglycerol kinase (ATP)
MSTRTRILINPTAGRGRASRLLAQLQARDDVELRTPAGPEALTEEASRAAEDGLERVVVVGGDGSLHQAIRGLAGTQTALGIVPAGTGNDLARALGLALDSSVALQTALHGSVRTIDLGRVDGKPFAGIAAIGFDSEVLDFMQRQPRKMRGPLAYAYAVLRTLLTFKPPTLRIESEGGTFEGPAMLAAVANSPVFGGGMRIAPEASLDDGWLNLVILKPTSVLKSLLLFAKVYGGTHVGHPAVSHHKVQTVTLFSDRPITANGDGEPLSSAGNAGTVVEIWPKALRVVTGD